MSKYKVGDEFIIEIEEVYEPPQSLQLLYGIKDCDTLLCEEELDKLKKPIKGAHQIYVKGMNDAWNIARELCKTGYNECTEMFGSDAVEYVIKNFDTLEVREEILAYKKKKEKEINVGDIVTVCDGDVKFVCTKDNTNGDYSQCHLMASDGSVWENCKKYDCKKTGKRVNISDLLDKI